MWKKKFGLKYKQMIFAVIILFCFWALNIGSVYGFSIFPDEYAYWSYGADIMGYDWSHITSLGPYYSYGYSLILAFIFALCKDAITAYRAAVSLNFLFLFLAFICLIKLLEKLAPEKKFPVMLVSALVVFTPWNLFYTQTTLTEVLLVSLYIAAGSLLFNYLENNRLVTLILLMLLLMYLYMVHMRTIGILLSGMIVLAIHILRRKKKKSHIFVMVGIAAVLFVLSGIWKEGALLRIYGGHNQELAAGNDYSGQLEKIHYILTGEGFYDLLVSIWGKILYLGLAGYGLFYWGIYGFIKWLRERWQEKKEFALFLLLCVAAQIIVSTIYLLTLGEISDYTYGRYNELLLPFVMAAGIITMWKEKSSIIWLVNGILAVIQMAALFCVVCQINNTGAKAFHGYFMVGISYLYRENSFTTVGFYTKAYLFCELLTILVTIAILFCRSKDRRKYVLTMLVVMELALAEYADNLYLEPFKKAAFRDRRMADKVCFLQEAGRRIVYVNHNPPAYIGILQFMERELEIQVVDEKEDVTKADLVILAFDDVWIQDLKDEFSQEDTYGHFTLLYNEER